MNANNIFDLHSELRNNEVVRVELITGNSIILTAEDILNYGEEFTSLKVTKELPAGTQRIIINLKNVVVACTTRKIKEKMK